MSSYYIIPSLTNVLKEKDEGGGHREEPGLGLHSLLMLYVLGPGPSLTDLDLLVYATTWMTVTSSLCSKILLSKIVEADCSTKYSPNTNSFTLTITVLDFDIKVFKAHTQEPMVSKLWAYIAVEKILPK